MDIVIPHSNQSHWECNELRYCLRSLEKNFKDIGQVFVMGHKPEWLHGAIHVNIEDDPRPEKKGANIIGKIFTASHYPFLSDDFLFCSDDVLVLHPMSKDDIKHYYTYDLKGRDLTEGNKFWMECLRNTRDTLLIDGLPCYNFETHTPRIYNRALFIETMNKYDWRDTLYPSHSLYYNNTIKTPEQMPSDYRVFFNEEGADLSLIEGKSFLSYNDLGLSAKLMLKIGELFPEPSRFEK